MFEISGSLELSNRNASRSITSRFAYIYASIRQLITEVLLGSKHLSFPLKYR